MKILGVIVIPFAFGVYYSGSSIHRAIDQVAHEWKRVASEIRGIGGQSSFMAQVEGISGQVKQNYDRNQSYPDFEANDAFTELNTLNLIFQLASRIPDLEAFQVQMRKVFRKFLVESINTSQ